MPSIAVPRSMFAARNTHISFRPPAPEGLCLTTENTSSGVAAVGCFAVLGRAISPPSLIPWVGNVYFGADIHGTVYLILLVRGIECAALR